MKRVHEMGNSLSFELVSDKNGATVYFRRKPEVSLEDVAKRLAEYNLPENTRYFEQIEGKEVEVYLVHKEI